LLSQLFFKDYLCIFFEIPDFLIPIFIEKKNLTNFYFYFLKLSVNSKTSIDEATLMDETINGLFFDILFST
jgi:hypothetical protein